MPGLDQVGEGEEGKDERQEHHRSLGDDQHLAS